MLYVQLLIIILFFFVEDDTANDDIIEVHMEMHEVEEYVQECIPEKIYRTSSTPKVVGNSKYETENGFVCPNGCGRLYRLKNSLYKHMKFDCGVEKQFECYVCGKQFSRKTSMRNHLFLVHRIVEPESGNTRVKKYTKFFKR